MFIRAFAIWFIILAAAFLNGMFRVAVLIPAYGEQIGHVWSTFVLCTVILIASWRSVEWVHPDTLLRASEIGLLWLALAAAVVAALLLVRFFSAPEKPMARGGGQGQRQLEVGVLVLRAETVEQKIFSSGTVMAREEVDLRSETDGRVTGVHFTEGTPVKKGSLLIKINDAELRARVRKIESHHRESEAAPPGTRVAVNLAGVDHTDLARGMAVVLPGQWEDATRLFKHPKIPNNVMVHEFLGLLGKPDAIVIFDEDERITLFNNAAERMFQFPVDQAIGRSVTDFIKSFESSGTLREVCAHARSSRSARPDIAAHATSLAREATHGLLCAAHREEVLMRAALHVAKGQPLELVDDLETGGGRVRLVVDVLQCSRVGGGCGERDDQLAHDVGHEPAARSCAKDLLHSELGELLDHDRRGRTPHPARLDGYGLPLERPGVAEEPAVGVHFDGVVEEPLGDVLRAQRVARQQGRLGVVARLGSEVDRHGRSLRVRGRPGERRALVEFVRATEGRRAQA